MLVTASRPQCSSERTEIWHEHVCGMVFHYSDFRISKVECCQILPFFCKSWPHQWSQGTEISLGWSLDPGWGFPLFEFLNFEVWIFPNFCKSRLYQWSHETEISHGRSLNPARTCLIFGYPNFKGWIFSIFSNFVNDFGPLGPRTGPLPTPEGWAVAAKRPKRVLT